MAKARTTTTARKETGTKHQNLAAIMEENMEMELEPGSPLVPVYTPER